MGKIRGGFAQVVVALCVASIISTPCLGDSPREIAKRVSPSVVMLVMEDSNGQPLALGSGFIVRNGVVATNEHVIEGAARGFAKFPGQKTKHDIRGIVASDPARDLVLLAVAGMKANPLPIADSNEVAVGEAVYAVGNPHGLQGTFSAGIVSSVRKFGEDSLLQITAPISPGSSGGPVVNSKGEVIGVAVATFKGGQNLNFAIPSRYLSALIRLIRAPVALPQAMKAGKGKNEKSILDDMGGRSTAALEAGQFLWAVRLTPVGLYSFSLRSKLREPVKDVVCLVIFHDADGKPIDADRVFLRGPIFPGLAKRVQSMVDSSVQRLTTARGSDVPRTRLEFRILDFDIASDE